MIVGSAAAGVLGGICGGGLLRRAWADRRQERPLLIAAGWIMLVAIIALDAAWVGAIKGAAIGIAAAGIGVLLVVAKGRVRRNARAGREKDLSPEPLEGATSPWRGWVRALLAGPLGMTAAMAVAFCYAAWAPGDPRTRIIIGGLLMPVIWALAMTWTLADRRLLRAFAVLSGTTVVGFAIAAVHGVA